MSSKSGEISDGDAVTFAVGNAKISVSCKMCGTTLLERTEHFQTGHTWANDPAVLYNGGNLAGLQISPRNRTLRLIQGEGTVSDAKCLRCEVNVGWVFVESPISTQKGKVGLRTPRVYETVVEVPPSVVVAPVPRGDALDALAHEYMKERGVLGLQYAFRDDEIGTLVSRAWGYVAPNLPLTTSMQLRVASVSKPITSAAVLLLVERGRLALDDKALPLVAQKCCGGRTEGVGKWLSTAKDRRVLDITVRHLLLHRSGGWPNDRSDPMFGYRGMNHAELIKRALADQALLADPGTTYRYSNFGYCLLGRVIEASDDKGRTYEEFVAQEVLARVCGGSASQYRCHRRTRCCYYASAPDKISSCDFALRSSRCDDDLVRRMDAHGGWILAADQLVAFSSALELRETASGTALLTAASYEKLRANPDEGNYAMGWNVNKHARWHNGSLMGTGSVLIRSWGRGVTFAIVANTSDEGSAGLSSLDPWAWKSLAAARDASRRLRHPSDAT